ncbi:hypothetical protein [Streptomyces sp. NPDC008092]|uniref:hypothetical protein n=1 Tax=Streptomyces sp. NPDC008092 TaxID=3364808 RepID=UPI0036E8C327
MPAPAASLALLADAGLVVAADGGDRLLRLDWPAGGPVTAVPMPFRVAEVHPATGGLLLVSGHGGEVEIRAEDGRTHLLTPGPVPSPPDGAGPGWLRDSVGVVLPERDAMLPAGIRRWGIGHVCLPASLAPDSEEFTTLLAQARDQGLRVLVELAPPGADPAQGELLGRAHGLLEETVDGLRLGDTSRWPASLVTRLRHLLDAYPQAAVVTTGTPHTALGTGHLALTTPPEPATAPSAPHGSWSLPDGLPRPRACLLLALPGCHEVPAAVLAPAGRTAAALRPLLAARAAQLALRHGGVEWLPTGSARVTAVHRSHAGQAVLCLTSTAEAPVTAQVPLPEATAGTELIEIAHDLPDLPDLPGLPDLPPAAPPRVLRPAPDGLVAVELDAGRTRWFRIRTPAHPPTDGATDPYTPPAR